MCRALITSKEVNTSNILKHLTTQSQHVITVHGCKVFDTLLSDRHNSRRGACGTATQCCSLWTARDISIHTTTQGPPTPSYIRCDWARAEECALMCHREAETRREEARRQLSPPHAHNHRSGCTGGATSITPGHPGPPRSIALWTRVAHTPANIPLTDQAGYPWVKVTWVAKQTACRQWWGYQGPSGGWVSSC